MPTLYTSDVTIAKPKAVRKKAAPISLGEAPSDDDSAPCAPDDKKAKAAAARAATRERKKQEKKQEEEQAAAAAEIERALTEHAAEAAAAKKAAAAEKRRLARQKRKERETTVETGSDASGESAAHVENPTAKPAKRVRVRSKPNAVPATPAPSAAGDELEEEAPPKWFSKWTTDMLTEQQMQKGTKLAKKELKRQGEELAQSHWDDPHTRKQVRGSQDAQAERLYSMIFAH